MLRIRNILAPVDFSDKSEAAAEHAAVLARGFGARLTLLHVFEPVPHEYLDLTPQGRAAKRLSSENERAEVRKRLGELARKVDSANPADIDIREGEAAHQIIEAAREREADLIVLPTHSGGAFRRFLLGSTTSKVLHDAEVPVLTGVHVDELPPFAQHPYHRVGVLLDLVEPHEDATVLRFAADLAEASEAELVVLHTPPGVRSAAAEWLPGDTKDLLVEAGRERVAKLLAENGIEAKIAVGRKDLDEFIETAVKENACDALVVPRSDADDLARRSPAPTFSV